jgi:hypothetical protein
MSMKPVNATKPVMTSSAPIRCAHCGHAYTRASWAELRAVHTLDRATVDAHLSRWPANMTIEVRACSGCAKPMARITAS